MKHPMLFYGVLQVLQIILIIALYLYDFEPRDNL